MGSPVLQSHIQAENDPRDVFKQYYKQKHVNVTLTLSVKLEAGAHCNPLLFAQTLSILRPPWQKEADN